MLLAIISLLTALLAAACGAPAQPQVTVSAAASLAAAFAEIGPLFEAETGLHPVYNIASSGRLAHQIGAGAPVDVFASANLAYLEELRDQGLVETGSIRIFGRGRLVLWSRLDQPAPAREVAALTGPAVRRFAIAHPEHAPYGAAARQALQRVGLWAELQPKLVLGENVGQALHYAERGDVDAALVSLSLAADAGGQWREVPDTLHLPIDQAIAVVAGQPQPRRAQRFVDFLFTPAGRAVLRRHGLADPTVTAPPP